MKKMMIYILLYFKRGAILVIIFIFIKCVFFVSMDIYKIIITKKDSYQAYRILNRITYISCLICFYNMPIFVSVYNHSRNRHLIGLQNIKQKSHIYFYRVAISVQLLDLQNMKQKYHIIGILFSFIEWLFLYSMYILILL